MKCAKCGKKIEHNQYKKVRGKYYCPECAPKKIKMKFVTTGIEDAIKNTNKFQDAIGKAVAKVVTPTEKTEFEMNDEAKVVVHSAIVTIPKKIKRKYKKRN